jgi:hypothetical protein
VKLRCYSFHSVKGGVGKSTLSTFLACGLARSMPTTLIDMDLTGTSLGDVLPLQAPLWSPGVELAKALATAPDNDFADRTTTLKLISKRNSEPGHAPMYLPFLNDFLLYATPDWGMEADVHARALDWRLDSPNPLLRDQLRIIPSSALPRDLDRILPVIFDEEHAAFLEGRLEFLLDGLVESTDPTMAERAVVFDTPPTIPGLSRTVLSLALRLGGVEKIPLDEEDGFIPDTLKQTDIDWTIFLVVTPDMQDLRAANRWLDLVERDEESLFRVVVNRANPQLERDGIVADIRRKLRGPDPLKAPAPLPPAISEEQLLAMDHFHLHVITDQPRMQFFAEERLPPEIAEVMDELVPGHGI